LGLEVRRRKRIEQLLPGGAHQLTATHIVEFLGPSGIGKSTIFNKSKAKLKYPWNFGYNSELYKMASCEEEIADIYRQLYWSSLQKVKSKGVNPVNETETIVNIIKRFQADLSMRCVSYTRGFFLAEGVFAYCSASAMELNKVLLKKITVGRSFVLVLPEKTETAVERFVEREKKTGIKRNYFRHLSHEELYEVQKRAINKQLEFGQAVERLGCKVLWLRAEDDVGKNVKKVIEFESNVVEEEREFQK
jgi:hypothetical protein